MIPPFVQKIIGAGLRIAIVWVAAKFGAEVSNDEAVKLAAQIAPVVAVALWSFWQKYRSSQKLGVALASPKVMTEKQAENVVSMGGAPSVLTPKNELPQ